MKWAFFAIAIAIGAGLSVLTHPLAPVAALVVVWLIVLVASGPYPALLAFLVVLMTRPAEFVPALEVFAPGKVASLMALGMLGSTMLMKRRLEWPKSPQTPLVVGLTFFVIVSSYMGTSPSASMATFNQVFVKILIIYFLILHLIDCPERLEGLQAALTAATASIAGYAFLMKVTGQADIEGSRAALVGYLGDPNDLAMTLLMCAPGALESAIRTHGWKKALWTLGFVLLVLGLISTQSRGGLIGLSAGVVVVMYSRVENKAALFATGAMVLVVGALAAGVADRKSGGAGEEGLDESAQGRLDAWIAGGRMITRNPVTGVGFDRFADNYLMYVSNTLIWKKHETHNAYIKAASEIGLPGAAMFIGLAGRALWGARRARERAELLDTEGQRAAAAGLVGSLTGFLIVIFFLSATWYWFPYILFAQAAATERVLDLAERDTVGGHR
jgi:hypothetical protein